MPSGRLQGPGHHVRPGDEGAVPAGPLDVGDAEVDGVLLLRHRPFGHVEQLVLDEDHRVVVADGARQQALGVVRRRRHGHLEAGDVVEQGLQALRVLGGDAVPHTALGAQDQGHRALASGHEPELGRLVHDLVHGEEGEVDEEDLHHGAHPRDGGADAGADDARLGDGGVDDALRSELGVQALGDLVGAAALADADADAEHRWVAGHLLAQGLVHGVPVEQGPPLLRGRRGGCGGHGGSWWTKASTSGSGLVRANSRAASMAASTSASTASTSLSGAPASARWRRHKIRGSRDL